MSGGWRARFLSEIKTTANLQHPHILALFDPGKADNWLSALREYLGEGSP